jgi:hypothetical protein
MPSGGGIHTINFRALLQVTFTEVLRNGARDLIVNGGVKSDQMAAQK